MGEGSPHLARDQDSLRDHAQRPKANFVFHNIAHQRACHSIPHLGRKLVTVVPTLERPFLLNVDKVMVPFKFHDASDPWGAKGKEWQNTNGDDDCRTNASECQAGNVAWRRLEFQSQKPRAARWRHDARQIIGIGKKEKDLLKRERDPLISFQTIRHSSPCGSFILSAGTRAA